MSEIQPFTFPATGQAVRTVTVDDSPWFVAADVTAVLGYGGGARNAVLRLPQRMRGVADVNTPGGPQAMVVISEPGVYRLAMRSNLPAAEDFQDWIAEDVVPSIRRTGSYVAPAAIPSHSEALRGWADEVERREAAERRAAELEPEAARARRTLDADGLSLVGTVAKRFGIKERALREFLFAEGLLIRGGARRNEPYARHIPTYFDVKTRLVDVHPDRAPEERSTTYVTPRGEALIWKRLYQAGLVSSPTMPAQQLALDGPR